MEALKQAEIWLPPHLERYAKAKFPQDADGRLLVRSIALMTSPNVVFIRDRKKKGNPVGIVTFRPSAARLFAIEGYLRDSFFNEMGYVAEGFKAAGLPTRRGIKAFLEKYAITEDLYSLDTAYRMYHKKRHRWTISAG